MLSALNREYTMASYLSAVTDVKLSKTLTMYRLSEHSLAVEDRPAQTDLALSWGQTLLALHAGTDRDRAALPHRVPKVPKH